MMVTEVTLAMLGPLHKRNSAVIVSDWRCTSVHGNGGVLMGSLNPGGEHFFRLRVGRALWPMAHDLADWCSCSANLESFVK